MNKVYQFELDYILKKIILRGYFILQVMKNWVRSSQDSLE